MKGTTPEGASGELEAARWVRSMFGRVARRYDLLNHLLSFNLDRRWRARTAARLKDVLAGSRAPVLDICCGTGDLALALEAAHGAPVFALDFSRPMLERAARKGLASCLLEADALQLPIAGASLGLVTVAFGLRNFAHWERGLAEMRRVLQPGGVAAILEFSRPPNRLFAALYDFYSRRLLPLIGGLISGSREAYTYLPDSVRKFPDAEDLARLMLRAGFTEVQYERMTGGIVALHLGRAAG